MTLEELTEINALVARARRHLADYDADGKASDYFLYHELWVELRDSHGLELPAFKGKRPFSVVTQPS